MYYIGNVKMNEITKSYINEMCVIKPNSGDTLGLALPFVYLPTHIEALKQSGYMVGAQNIHCEQSGAYTGEISAKMIKELNCDFVIIGHSERRKYFFESNSFLHKKVLSALQNHLTPIICVGETETDRLSGKTLLVIKKQLLGVLKDIYSNEIGGIFVAYEPISAIGSKPPTKNKIEEVINYIKKLIASNFDGKEIKVLYGGGCNEDNISKLKTIKNCDGFLIGGACLNSNSFKQIVLSK